MRAVSFLLVLALAFTGFVYPGFLRRKGDPEGFHGWTPVATPAVKPGGFDGGTRGSRDSAFDFDLPPEALDAWEDDSNEDAEAFFDTDFGITPETSPGNPFLIESVWSQEEIASAETVTGPLDWESPQVEVSTSAGPVAAAFNGWDLDSDEDAFVVRTLHSKHDEASETTLYGYDLSLASGQHDFTSHNCVTIPRNCADGQDGYVAYYNPETGHYENAYYEVSADGASYDVYLDHFSLVAEVVPDYILPSFLEGKLFYEPEFERVMPVMYRSVALSNAALEEWMRTKSVDLPNLAVLLMHIDTLHQQPQLCLRQISFFQNVINQAYIPLQFSLPFTFLPDYCPC